MTIAIAPHILEATRLTREGRLEEAVALLRGQGTPAAPGAPSARAAPDVLDADVLDLAPPTPSTGGAWAWPKAAAGAGTASDAGARPKAHAPFVAGRHARSPAAPPLPAGARFETRVHEGPEGRRAYRLYVPADRPAGPRPLVVMLHGCTQSPDDFAAGTRMNAVAEEHGLLVAYPEQTQAANVSRCWNWFDPAHQGRDRGEPALIAGIVRDVAAALEVDGGRVFAAGLSAGGAQAAVMGAAYPDVFAAVGVHSGLACGAATDVASAFAAMRQGGGGPAVRAPVPAIIVHGDRDGTVHPSNAEALLAQAGVASGGASETAEGVAAGGRRFTRTIHRDGDGRVLAERWVLHGAGHAWSGGSASGSYTDPTGPDASREMVRFFLAQPPRGAAGR